MPRARPISLLVSILTALALAAAGCGGDSKDNGGTNATSSTSTGAKGGCEQVQRPVARRVTKRRPPDFRLSQSKTYIATVETSCGTFEIKLDPKQAPRTGGSFVTLARKRFYDGLTFHRIVRGFVIQGGDPHGIGNGGPGYTIRERPPRDVVYSTGVVAMAKTGTEPPGTSGSQFFVVTTDDSGLTPDYALLGEVTKGLDVVHRIEAVPVDPANDQPLQPVVIKRIRISTK